MEATEVLLDAGADIDCRDENGMTPLMLAVESNSPSMMKWLLDHKSNPQLTSTSGWKAIHLAIRLGHESCVLLLLQEGVATVDEEDANGLTPLDTAAEVGNEDIACILLDKGADVSYVGEKRKITALHVATYHNQAEMVKLLLDKGVTVNAQDANGHTAMHIAALLNHASLIPLLLGAHVDISLQDQRGRTAEQLAMQSGSDDVVRQFDVLKL